MKITMKNTSKRFAREVTNLQMKNWYDVTIPVVVVV